MMFWTRKLAAVATVFASLSIVAADDYGFAAGGYRLDDRYSDNGRDRELDRRYRLTDTYRHELSRLRSGYDYRAPLDSMVDDRFRDSQYRSRRYDDMYDSRNREFDRLADPFRTRDSRRNVYPVSRRDDFDRSREQSRYRIPFDRANDRLFDRDFDRDRPYVPSRDLSDYDQFDRRDYRSPGHSYPDSRDSSGDRDSVDPFTPPLPRRETGSEADAIRNAISARYGNPVNVRTVRSMSASQGLALYREVSQQTDQRHLEPSSYDLRIRRGLRNLGLALENETFTKSLGVRSDSFATDSFRSQLSRIAQNMQVSGYQDAERVVQTVMQQADSIQGLTPSVVAFEFASATVDTLDKFSALEPRDVARGASLDLTEETRSAALESEIVGIGVEIKDHDRGLLIMKALRGGPAAEAGLQAGDIITAIDDRDIAGMPMANSVDLMKGSSGSRIRLTVVRNGSRGGSVTLTRRRVRIYTVNDMKLIPNTQDVAYISLSQFGQKSTEELDEALNQLYSRGMKSLILDLRGNPGGLLNVCVDITNRFLPCGTIVSTKGRLASDNMIETATYSRTWSTPLVVLIDGDSASASEIFAAAVQDNRRGIVVGEKSYGKGTVQTHFPLSSVSGNLRLTTARFYSPNGRPMTGSGVTPDVPVEDIDGPANGDRMLEQAITIAQSQRLKDIAQAAKQCRPSAGHPLQKNSRKLDIDDTVTRKTVLR